MTNKSESDFVVIPAPGGKYILGDFAREDEISLIDLWKILVKRKALLFSVVLLSMIVAGVWIFISKPVYESRAVLVVGQVAPVGQLESPQTLMQRLREEYKVNDSSEGGRKLPLVKEVGLADRATPNAIEITVRGYSASQAQSFLRSVVEKILSDHKNLYEIGVSAQNKLLELFQGHRKEIQNALIETRKQISQTRIDPSISGLLALEMDKLSSQLLDIDQKESQLKLSMSELQSQATAVIRQPTLPVSPVKPKPVKYMVVAGVVGLILGILVVYIAEFLAKVRVEESKNSSNITLP